MTVAAAATSRTCICCGACSWMGVHPDIVGCRTCGYQRIAAQVTLADLEALYGETFFRGDKYHDYSGEKEIIASNLAARLDAVLRHVGSARDKDLLEVGAAYGYFLEMAERSFQTARGIDIATTAAAAARSAGLDVRTGDLLTSEYASAAFDVIVMWDTIEHLDRPELYCARAFDLLRPGGYFFATTGDVGSLLARVQRRQWRLYDPPIHVHYFTRPSLGRMLFDMGFTVVGYESCAATHSVQQIVHGLGIYANRPDGVLRRLCRWLYPRLPPPIGAVRVPIDVGDVFMIVARK